MATLVQHTVDYAKHGSVQKDVVHHITLGLPGLPAGKIPPIVITHRGGSVEPLWFVHNHADGMIKAPSSLVAAMDDVVVLLPGEMYRIDPGYLVTQVALTANALAGYSVVAVW